jgi:hypothetical protein
MGNWATKSRTNTQEDYFTKHKQKLDDDMIIHRYKVEQKLYANSEEEKNEDESLNKRTRNLILLTSIVDTIPTTDEENSRTRTQIALYIKQISDDLKKDIVIHNYKSRDKLYTDKKKKYKEQEKIESRQNDLRELSDFLQLKSTLNSGRLWYISTKKN